MRGLVLGEIPPWADFFSSLYRAGEDPRSIFWEVPGFGIKGFTASDFSEEGSDTAAYMGPVVVIYGDCIGKMCPPLGLLPSADIDLSHLALSHAFLSLVPSFHAFLAQLPSISIPPIRLAIPSILDLNTQ